jgi:hypothetical protein
MRAEQFGEGFRIAGAYPVTQGKFHNQPCPLGTRRPCGGDHITSDRSGIYRPGASRSPDHRITGSPA